MLTLGPPCGSFVWINSSTSGRSAKRPYGREDRAYVNLASLKLGSCSTRVSLQPRIASRALLLVVLATARGCYTLLEQPSSSMLKFYPDLVRTGKLIATHLGGIWNSVALSPSQTFSHLVFIALLSESNGRSWGANLEAQQGLGDGVWGLFFTPRSLCD